MSGFVCTFQMQLLLWTPDHAASRRKSILQRALMPITSLTAASTEQNACTSPPQQLFSNLNDRAEAQRRSMVSTPPLLFSRLDKLTPVPPALSSYTYTMRAACSLGFVRAEKQRKPLTEGENYTQKKKSPTIASSVSHVKSIRFQSHRWLLIPSCSPPSLCPFVCPTFHHEWVEEIGRDSSQTCLDRRWQVTSCSFFFFFSFLHLPALCASNWKEPSRSYRSLRGFVMLFWPNKGRRGKSELPFSGLLGSSWLALAPRTHDHKGAPPAPLIVFTISV